MVLLLSGAIGSLYIGATLPYCACALVELYLIMLLVTAIRMKETRYVYTLVGTIICIAGTTLVIGEIINKLNQASHQF